MTRPFLAKYHVYYEEKKLSSCSLEMKILPLQNVYHVPELNVTPFQVLGNVLLNAKLCFDFIDYDQRQLLPPSRRGNSKQGILKSLAAQCVIHYFRLSDFIYVFVN